MGVQYIGVSELLFKDKFSRNLFIATFHIMLYLLLNFKLKILILYVLQLVYYYNLPHTTKPIAY
jgi:hypothetical protein